MNVDPVNEPRLRPSVPLPGTQCIGVLGGLGDIFGSDGQGWVRVWGYKSEKVEFDFFDSVPKVAKFSQTERFFFFCFGVSMPPIGGVSTEKMYPFSGPSLHKTAKKGGNRNHTIPARLTSVPG